jgi:hypothetical protein
MSTKVIGFPSNPSVDDEYQGWVWDGDKWVSDAVKGGLWEQSGDDIYYNDGNVSTTGDFTAVDATFSGDVSAAKINASSTIKQTTVGYGQMEFDGTDTSSEMQIISTNHSGLRFMNDNGSIMFQQGTDASNIVFNLLPGGDATFSGTVTATSPSNAGAPTSTIDPAILLMGGDSSVGDGGEIGFGAFTNRKFAAIKGSISDANSNGAGHLDFYTRENPNTAEMSRALRITSNGNATFSGSVNAEKEISTDYYLKTNSWRSKDQTVGLFMGASSIYPTNYAAGPGGSSSGEISVGTSASKFKDGYFTGTIDAAEFTINGVPISGGGGGLPGGDYTYTGVITAKDFIATSDERLKTSIAPMPVGLIDDIKPVSWEWIEGGGKSAGVVAQQLQEIGLGDYVHENDDGELGVNYQALTAILLAEVIALKKAIK